MMSARKASPIDGSRAIASAKVWRMSAAETSGLSSRAATRWATELSSVSWLRIVVIRKVASSGSRRIASSASCRMRANRGSFPASPTIRAVKPCAMTFLLDHARFGLTHPTTGGLRPRRAPRAGLKRGSRGNWSTLRAQVAPGADPFPAPLFPGTREQNREKPEFRPPTGKAPRKGRRIQGSCANLPYAKEQGSNSAYQGASCRTP